MEDCLAEPHNNSEFATPDCNDCMSRLSNVQLCAKRVIDVLISVGGLLLLSPFLLAIALAVKLDSDGPAIFKQSRVGLGGRIFLILKFRTMSTLDNGILVRQATRDDKRVTRVGRFLRASSLDELPQLINVLQGDMSIIGPRPHAVSHDNEYAELIPAYKIRHMVKPGITGWAQVNGYRGETKELASMKGRVKHDIWYISHWSLFLEMRILMRTLSHVLTSRDAY